MMEEQVSKLDASRTLALFSFRRQEGLQNICRYVTRASEPNWNSEITFLPDRANRVRTYLTNRT